MWSSGCCCYSIERSSAELWLLFLFDCLELCLLLFFDCLELCGAVVVVVRLFGAVVVVFR